MSEVIRQATIDDAREIARIHVTGWKTAYAGIVPQAYLDSLTIEGRTGRFRDTFGAYGERFLVYEADTGLKGFVIQGPTLDEDCPGIHEIQALYVEPASWRQGVGTRLVREAERVMLERGMIDITLWVFRDNHRSRAFYEAVGYLPDGAVKTAHIGGAALVEVRLRKRRGSANQCETT